MSLFKHALTALLLVGLSTLSMAERAEPLSYLDELPPQLDRDLFFGDPEVSGAQLSPDGRFITFLRPYQGVRNIWIKSIDEAFDEARPLTADDKPVPGYFWSRDGQYVLYVQDKGGDENFHVWAVNPDGEVEAESGVPAARNLTDFDGVRAMLISRPKSRPDELLVGLNDRDPALHDVYRVTISTGERELVIENNQNIAGWFADLDGNLRMAIRQDSEGGTEVLRVADGALGEVIYQCSWQEACGPMRFHADGEQIWFQSNKGDEVDLIGLYLMNPDTGELTLVERDPEGQVDFSGAVFHPVTEELQATVYVGDRTRIYPKDDAFAADLAFLRENLPEGEIGLPSQTSDGRLALVSLSRDVDPGSVYVFDREARSVELLYRSRPELPTEHLANMQPIRYQARDGLEIPAYLTLPQGVEPRNLGVVAVIHGGPWARDTWGYNSLAQFLANRGYAVIQPNFRASTGYGKAFLNAGNNEWGDAMQDDITDGIQYLVDQGIADPERVCIMGGSYGGYATLAGMTFTPELYACGVNIVGVSNLISLLNSIPAYWGPARKIFTLRMGDPDTEEGRAQLERQSPINHVDKIERPLLIIHGANDPRVKQAEADQIVVAMRERGLEVEYIVAPDEGHGFRGRENRLAMFARTEEFLSTHLGGRYQPEMAPDIAERLAAITVDIDTVVVENVADELDAARTLPLPAVDADQIATGSFSYLTTLALPNGEMTMESTREIARSTHEDREVIELRTSSSSAMGELADRFIIDGTSLRPIRRETSQGAATITIDYSSREVSGSIEMGSNQIPVNIELEAPVFGSDTGLEAALAGLPFRDGLRTVVRVAEVGMQQRVRYFQVQVSGPESVEVPAGSFNAWKIELNALDGEGGDQTIWVSAEAPHRTVRIEGKLAPQMGGGDYSTVLTSANE
ncbi:alpha/beta fold hydrolase [Wenzhouxiangella marina]|uniref:Peptidase S9 prolyl oligopeptidase active site domain protein n=1 Tax=Wenzhouxiangella marina TaxID=1579979 RepID=A0A0K0XRT2_9GAMM|nr:alpha/beta fold hydrolase [Wenzhouxiangella marina]AKS40424.1 Peptidase S9 prolyl oligopeptidase active site domain protein [Wenzhouxiangella marina]MBB6088254.1 dipeptidyl aminopeptidase/acylaminoacyl peptidase [Wenzhouxiangella marina]